MQKLRFGLQAGALGGRATGAPAGVAATSRSSADEWRTREDAQQGRGPQSVQDVLRVPAPRPSAAPGALAVTLRPRREGEPAALSASCGRMQPCGTWCPRSGSGRGSASRVTSRLPPTLSSRSASGSRRQDCACARGSREGDVRLHREPVRRGGRLAARPPSPCNAHCPHPRCPPPTRQCRPPFPSV